MFKLVQPNAFKRTVIKVAPGRGKEPGSVGILEGSHRGRAPGQASHGSPAIETAPDLDGPDVPDGVSDADEQSTGSKTVGDPFSADSFFC